MALRDEVTKFDNGPGVPRLVTPSDVTDLTEGVCRALWVGTAGNISFIDEFGTTLSGFPALPGLNPIRAKRILSTGTTATGIWAIY